MYFMFAFMLLIFGIIVAGICTVLPWEMFVTIPMDIRIIMFIFGFMLPILGYVMLYTRAKRIGADHLIAPRKPGTVLWFYFYRDNEMIITPAMRSGEGQLYNSRMDSQIIDVKTYTLGDKKIRIVPEVVGHAVDLDYVMYADLLKTQHGYENLKEARESFPDRVMQKFGIKRTVEIPAQENFLVGKEIEKYEKEQEEEDEQ